jgi:hypothetical protein
MPPGCARCSTCDVSLWGLVHLGTSSSRTAKPGKLGRVTVMRHEPSHSYCTDCCIWSVTNLDNLVPHSQFTKQNNYIKAI